MSVDLAFRQANAAMRAGDFAEAERQYLALVDEKPLWALHNLGALYVAAGRFADGEAAFRQALEVDPAAPLPRHALGMLLMAAGRYAEGWPLMEARRDIPGMKIPSPAVACPEWRGEDLAGKRLLVWFEQGLGDQIQFFRFLLALKDAGARVTLLCDPSL
ncbi:MAG: tetratricopeptide repeat protein, partial [Phenylobacterium sp.]